MSPPRADVRAGIGYDSHRFARGRKLVLAGVEVPEAEEGLTGHSDADAATHAVIDALLGAAGLDDIGAHFPDSDPRYRDADSLLLLERTRALLAERRLVAVSVDLSIVCERPKLGAYRERMRERLAAAAGLPAAAVNVKFTTNEGMGFVGRGEGVAAFAVANVAEG